MNLSKENLNQIYWIVYSQRSGSMRLLMNRRWSKITSLSESHCACNDGDSGGSHWCRKECRIHCPALIPFPGDLARCWLWSGEDAHGVASLEAIIWHFAPLIRVRNFFILEFEANNGRRRGHFQLVLGQAVVIVIDFVGIITGVPQIEWRISVLNLSSICCDLGAREPVGAEFLSTGSWLRVCGTARDSSVFFTDTEADLLIIDWKWCVLLVLDHDSVVIIYSNLWFESIKRGLREVRSVTVHHIAGFLAGKERCITAVGGVLVDFYLDIGRWEGISIDFRRNRPSLVDEWAWWLGHSAMKNSY